MTFRKFRETVLSKGYTDDKGFKKFILRTALFFLIFTLSMGLFTASTINAVMGIIVMCVSVVAFFVLLSFAAESAENFQMALNCTRFWWVSIIIAIFMFIILFLFNAL